MSDNDEKAAAVLGLALTAYLILILIEIALFIWIIWFAIRVMKKCKGKPGWLNPVLITLLVLYVIFGWYPPIGICLFIPLLIICIVYNNQCKK
jgi:hypothetical protein